MTEEEDGLVCAFLRNDGGWTPVDWSSIRGWTADQGLLWVHLDWRAPGAQEYLREQSGIDPIGVDALLAEESRPRALSIGESFLINLRGVNLNPGADPEDMVSIRVWIEPYRIISSRHRRLLAINDIREEILSGGGPSDQGEFLSRLASGLVTRMIDVIDQLDEHEDRLEEQMLDEAMMGELRGELTQLRRQTISLRRYLAPQRDALLRAQTEPVPWLNERHRAQLREAHNQIARFIEDLDAIRERGMILQEEMQNRLSEKMNKNMYMLTIVATIMLPLGVVTGLLGINVDGMPGAENSPLAFLAVCLMLTGIAAIGIWILRRLNWF